MIYIKQYMLLCLSLCIFIQGTIINKDAFADQTIISKSVISIRNDFPTKSSIMFNIPNIFVCNQSITNKFQFLDNYFIQGLFRDINSYLVGIFFSYSQNGTSWRELVWKFRKNQWVVFTPYRINVNFDQNSRCSSNIRNINRYYKIANFSVGWNDPLNWRNISEHIASFNTGSGIGSLHSIEPQENIADNKSTCKKHYPSSLSDHRVVNGAPIEIFYASIIGFGIAAFGYIFLIERGRRFYGAVVVAIGLYIACCAVLWDFFPWLPFSDWWILLL